jgi:hypothetical protein
MKTSIFLTAMAITLTSFTANVNTTSEQIGRKALSALKHVSHTEYASLYPTLADFHKMMDANAAIYGNSLSDAKNEFAMTYAKKIIPAMDESFDRILKEGKELGIDWASIQYLRVEQGDIPNGKFGSATFTIVFSANEKEHRIVVEKALLIEGQWKVSQFARII